MFQRVQGLLAVGFSIALLLSSSVGAVPVTQGTPSAPTAGSLRAPAERVTGFGSAGETTSAGSQNGTDSTNSSLSAREDAIALLKNSSLPGKGKGTSDLADRLNRTTTSYIDPNRTVGSPFGVDQKIAAQTQQRVPAVADELAVSDRRLAQTAIADVNRTRQILADRGVDVDVQRELDRARRAFTQGRQLEDSSPVGAIQQYRRAWEIAQGALDELDETVTPQVRLASRADPPHEPGVNYTVRGSVFDVRTYEIDTVTVTLDGGTTQTVSLNTTTRPAVNGSFNATVELSRDRNVINISATDPGTELGARTSEADDTGRDGKPGQGNPEGGPPAERGSSGQGHGDESGADGSDPTATGTATLRLDADGLPDVYEESVVGTGPLDADSDAAPTPQNEADNGVIDGLEDFDNDTVSTYKEYQAGTDPLVADTDGDGLSDGFELEYKLLDPTTNDTDGDGTPDGAEDFDEDTLTNSEEAALGTSPTAADTDRDTLRDDREQTDLGTEPDEYDTDSDGLDDGTEVELGTDPLDPDTDGDGVLDGNETFTTTATNDTLGLSVATTGQGNIADTLEITRRADGVGQDPRVRNQSVASVVDIETDRQVQEATLTFEYNDSRVPGGNESTLAVFRYNETLQNFVPLNSSVDPSTNTITAKTTGFSTFTVFSIPNWGAQFDADEPRTGGGDGGAVQPIDVAFVIDSSGSLGSTDPNGFRKVAAKRFVGALLPEDRAAVVDFDFDGRVLQSFTSDFAAVNNSIESLDSFGGTSIAAGIRTTNQEFDEASNASRAKIIILLTDGLAPRAPARDAARESAARNITIYSIGFGNSDEVLLRDVADITDGQFYNVDQASDLPQVFSRVAENATGPTNSDGDRFRDALEETGIPVGVAGVQTNTIVTNPLRTDTDGDGLDDDEEIGERVDITKTVTTGVGPITYEASYYRFISDPTRADTDGDALQDFEEQNTWDSNPRRANTDGDVLADFQDPRLRTEDTPPEVTIKSNNWADVVYLVVDDQSSIQSVEGNPFYDPVLGDAGYRPSLASTRDLDTLDEETRQELVRLGLIPEDADYAVSFDNFGLIDEPKRYYINVTDANDNDASFQIDVTGSGAELAKASFGIAGAAIVPEPEPTVIGDELIIGGGFVLVGGLLYGASQLNLLGTEGTVSELSAETKLSATERTYEGTAVGDVRLPVGFVTTSTSALIGETSRGYGWEYISTTTTITQDELQFVLTNDPLVITRGQKRIVIGENRAGDERLLEIIGGTLVAASTGATVEDPCDEIVNVEENGDHATRDEKPVDDKSTLRELIRNEVVKIVEAAGQRYYVVKLGTNQYTLVVADGGTGYWIIQTILTSATDDGLYKSIKDAIKDIKAPEDAQDVIYDPENGIDC